MEPGRIYRTCGNCKHLEEENQKEPAICVLCNKPQEIDALRPNFEPRERDICRQSLLMPASKMLIG